MLKTNLKSKKRFKIDTDRFELSWHALIADDNERIFIKSVWAAPTYVGPEAYNSGHIDFILDNNPRNDVRTILNRDDGRFVCRRTLDEGRAKFMP